MSRGNPHGALFGRGTRIPSSPTASVREPRRIASGTVPAPAPTPLLSRRLIYVLGKGGAGRTTIAAALGLAASRRGARTLVAEVSGRGELAQLFGRAPDGGEVEVAADLWSLQLDTSRALEEYLHEHLPLRLLADVIGATRLIGYLAAATPGLRELLNAGKLWELGQPERRIPGAQPYDLVIVDAPASGHALSLLTAPGAFARAAQAGPIARQGQKIDDTLHDPAQTGLIGVVRGEDAAVSELLDLALRLRRELGLAPELVVVNALPAEPLDAPDVAALEQALASFEGGARAALARTLAQDRSALRARDQVLRLARELPAAAIVELAEDQGPAFGLAALERLAEQLDGAL
jgi:anion-transporting  ArsA/GET3 family ATPase